jgi:hypothetical protein
MMQRHKLEINSLNHRPHHPILLQRVPVRAIQLVLRARALHERHAAEEDEEVGAGEDGLVAGDAGDDLGVFVAEDDFVLQEFEPGRCCGSENCCGGLLLAMAMFLFLGAGEMYLHRTRPCVRFGPARGSSILSFQRVVGPWYHRLRRGLRW